MPRLPVWLVIAYILSLLTLAAWPFVAFMSVFAFDAPGTAQGPAVWSMVITVLAYPLLPLIGVPASFFSYRANHKMLGYILAGIAAIPLAILVVILIVLLVTSFATLLGLRF